MDLHDTRLLADADAFWGHDREPDADTLASLTEDFDDATHKANHGIPGRWRAPQPSLATWTDWQADALTDVASEWHLDWGSNTARLCADLEASRIAELDGKPFASRAAARRWARFGAAYSQHRCRALEAFADRAGYNL